MTGSGLKVYHVDRVRLLTSWWEVSEDCYSKDKRSHQSKLKRALCLEWDPVQACTCMCACVQACIYVNMQPAQHPRSVLAGWIDRGHTGTNWDTWAQFNASSSAASWHSFFSFYHHTPHPGTHKMPVSVMLSDNHINKSWGWTKRCNSVHGAQECLIND